MPLCLIGLGSNVGERRRLLEQAVASLRATTGVDVQAVSRWYQTLPAGGPAGQSPYLNGVLLLETSLDPHQLLKLLHAAEAAAGRTREIHYGPRTLDLDLLLYGNQQIKDDRLTVPHPRMAWRRFVLAPAAEIAADLRHPYFKRTIAQLLAHLNASARYVALAGPEGVGKTEIAAAVARQTQVRVLLDPIPSPDSKDRGLSGRALDTAIELLARRRQLLARDVWPSDAPWTVSDFSFEEQRAAAELWLQAEDREAFVERFEQARSEIVLPVLTVLLDLPTDELLRRIHERGAADVDAWNAELLNHLRDALVTRLESDCSTPVMRLEAADLHQAVVHRAVDEIRAAIEAMDQSVEPADD